MKLDWKKVAKGVLPIVALSGCAHDQQNTFPSNQQEDSLFSGMYAYNNSIHVFLNWLGLKNDPACKMTHILNPAETVFLFPELSERLEYLRLKAEFSLRQLELFVRYQRRDINDAKLCSEYSRVFLVQSELRTKLINAVEGNLLLSEEMAGYMFGVLSDEQECLKNMGFDWISDECIN